MMTGRSRQHADLGLTIPLSSARRLKEVVRPVTEMDHGGVRFDSGQFEQRPSLGRKTDGLQVAKGGP